MRIDDDGTRFKQVDFRSGQQFLVDAVQPVDFLVLVGNQRCPIEGCFANGPAVIARILEILVEMGRVGQQLLRDAAADDAGATQSALFRNGDLGAVAGRNPCRTHAARPTTDDKEIVIELGHLNSPPLNW